MRGVKRKEGRKEGSSGVGLFFAVCLQIINIRNRNCDRVESLGVRLWRVSVVLCCWSGAEWSGIG